MDENQRRVMITLLLLDEQSMMDEITMDGKADDELQNNISSISLSYLSIITATCEQNLEILYRFCTYMDENQRQLMITLLLLDEQSRMDYITMNGKVDDELQNSWSSIFLS